MIDIQDFIDTDYTIILDEQPVNKVDLSDVVIPTLEQIRNASVPRYCPELIVIERRKELSTCQP